MTSLKPLWKCPSVSAGMPAYPGCDLAISNRFEGAVR